MEPCTIQPEPGKIKKYPPGENLLYFRKGKPPKKLPYIFSKQSFSYTSGNENPKKFLIFSGYISYITLGLKSFIKTRENLQILP